MLQPKQVKVDNWGIYFLQRLKHFFNRTDYCDLTLQFQDNAQLKVHRLVLSACTEYFELLERTCEMYEDCLVMPDDLQADVVVPIVNFMYTGQLEFKMDILERLHATSEIMNMPVLTKLLDSHRTRNKLGQSYGKRQSKQQEIAPAITPLVEIISPTPSAPKRSFAKAFEKSTSNVVYTHKKHFQPLNKARSMNVSKEGLVYQSLSSTPKPPPKTATGEPRPTRYELPEELDTDNIFENSFCNISYTSRPLMVHPETTKKYAKRPKQDKSQASTSKKSRSAILNIVECKKIEKEPEESFYEESESDMISDETQMFKPAYLNTVNVQTEHAKDPNKLFDQLLDEKEESAKVTIETTKNNKAGASLDHAKIISEVLKKYPHLVKSNKNIKLKIFNNPTPSKGTAKKQKLSSQTAVDKGESKNVETYSDYTYETDVLDSKQAAKLIALGAENIAGPWICLICGTPGKALHFTSYFKFRRHLVDVHKEKPVLNICEYCGQRMWKRNHLLHHMYTKHGVNPPPSYNFPKCPHCSYIALTEALLVKHKLSHTETKNFRCNVCPSSFTSSNLLLAHIQQTGHKYIADRKHSHQCIYCLRIFVRENNLYAHLKTHHKINAVKDGIIDESDDEIKEEQIKAVVKHEPVANDYEGSHMEYHIQQKADGNIQLVQKKHTAEATTPLKQKILNSDLTSETPKPATVKSKVSQMIQNIEEDPNEDEISTFSENNEEIVVIDNNEYIMCGNRLILRKPSKEPSEEYIISDMIDEKPSESSIVPSTSMDYTSILHSNDDMQQASIILKDAGNLSESIPIYVSNEVEYKALMSSNHNIIFDAGDTNKTLAVLTTPDAVPGDNSRINSENSQNNDMMVIHEATYPLNVTEAVVTDNSNIVVVYSQQVDGPNKEYQLLTTQALGQQYDQSSAILTQNYETVSTASAVMSAHILDSQAAEWQGDIHQNIDSQHTEVSAVLQTIVHAEEVEPTSAPECTEDISDLPEVPLISETANFNETENISSEPEPELIKSSENMSMEVEASDTPSGVIEENIESFTSVEPIPENDEVQEIVAETEVLKQADSQEIERAIPENTEVEQQQENISMDVEQQLEIITMDVQSSNNNEHIMDGETSNTNENVGSLDIQNSDTNENIVSTDTQSANINETAEMNIDEPIPETTNLASLNQPVSAEAEPCATAGIEQVQTLASKWTEDNVETISQDSNEEAEEHIDSEEVEDSVEDIQHEPENSAISTTDPDDEEDTTEKSVACTLEKDKLETSKVIEPRVKISSILNDWDDNDESQEDNETLQPLSTQPIKEVTLEAQNPDTNSFQVIPVTDQELITDNVSSETEVSKAETPSIVPNDIIENNTTDVETNLPLENENVDKQDKIKSLVSDWDDDDEDNKE